MKHHLLHSALFTRLNAALAAALFGLLAIAHVCIAQPSSEGPLVEEAFSKLGLVGGEIVEVLPVATASGGLQVAVPISGSAETIALTPFSVRAPDYTVLVQKNDGSYQVAEPTPERNYRGTVIGFTGSAVAATYDESGLTGKILMPDGSRYFVEPLAGQVAGASPEQHIVYRDEDTLINNERTCPEPLLSHDHDEEHPVGTVAGTPGLYVAELAIDADYEYFKNYATVAGVQNQVNAIINTMNVQYERDVQIRHIISTIIVRSTDADPYSATNADALLSQFRNHWNSSQGNVSRDVAQLFTGKELDGNVIGIAFLENICTASAYGLVQSNFSGSLAERTDLSAHELGHNWGAEHCPCSSPPSTMNPSITGANNFSGTYSIPQIVAYRDTLGCLDIGDELLRIIVGAPATTFEVGQVTQLACVADFRYGPNQDVAPEVSWSVDRPEFAQVSPEGLLILLDADAESCVMVNASYTYAGVTKTDELEITVKDPTDQFAIVASSPPQNAIDARRPSDPSGNNRTGWKTFDLTLSSEPCSIAPSRFVVSQVGGAQPVPVVSSVQSLGANVVRITLNKAIDPGAWTTIDDTLSDVSLVVGYLPGDVNGNGSASPSDILALIDALNGIISLPDYATDADRSGATAPADIVTLIDLLNGAGGYAVWNGVSLP